MTTTADRQITQPTGNLLALCGIVLGFVAILAGILVPFFVPPLLKHPHYLSLFQSIYFDAAWSKAHLAPLLKTSPLVYVLLRDLLRVLSSPLVLCAILGPAMALLGLFRQQQRPAAAFKHSLSQLLGCQIMLGSFAWLLWQSIQLAQTGWMALRQGALVFAQQYPALFWGPLLLAIGMALLTQPNWKTRTGLILSASAYHMALVLGFYLLFATTIAKQFPMRFQVPGSLEITTITWRLGVIIPLCLLFGTALMQQGKRLGFHLMMTSPLWVPFFIVFFFWSLIVNTTFYFIEDLTGRTFQPHPVLKVVVYSWICLPLFPLLLTIDFGISLIRFLGQAAVDQLFPPNLDGDPNAAGELSSGWTHALGATLLLTVPLWILPAFAYWSGRLFIVESLLQSLQGRPQTPHDPTATERS